MTLQKDSIGPACSLGVLALTLIWLVVSGMI